MTGLFLAWYLLYVLLASYAPSFMAIKLVGNINVGLVFGLLQFVSTFLITFLYVRFADRKLEPLAAQLRTTSRHGGRRTEGVRQGRPVTLAAGVEGSNPILNLTIFALFVIATLAIVIRVSKRASSGASDFYTAGGGFSGPQNGIAISGDYLSAASFLGIAGAIARQRLRRLPLLGRLPRGVARGAAAGRRTAAQHRQVHDGRRAGVPDAPAPGARRGRHVHPRRVVLLPARPDGRRGRPGRAAAQRHQQGRAGGRHRHRRRRDDRLRADRRHAGHDVGADHQGGTADRRRRDHDVWVLALYGFSLSAVLGDAVARAGATGEKLLAPGAQYGKNGTTRLDFISLALALVLGTAGLPHILMRFYTVPTAKEARRSVVWAISSIGLFYLFTLVVGYGAVALVGPDAIKKAPGWRELGGPAAGLQLGGTVLLGIIAAVAFATILAVVAGLTITASASFATTSTSTSSSRGPWRTRRTSEVKVARRTAIIIGIVAISAGSWPRRRASPSSWRWPSRSRRRRTCRRSCTSCSGSGPHHGELCSIYGGLGRP